MRIAVCGGLVVLAIVVLPAHVAWAGSGPDYTATYTPTPPTIDGSLSDSAWASAQPYSLMFGSTPATVRFLRDDSNLYVGVTVDDPAPGPAPSLTTYFDNGNLAGASPVIGDDAWIADLAAGEDYYFQGGGEYASDSTDGGTSDTSAAAAVNPGSVSFELEHPLCTSGDTTHDVCITSLDQVVGVNFQYEPDTTPGVFYDGPGGFQNPSTWASLDVPPVSYTCAATATTLFDNWDSGTVSNGGLPPTFSTGGKPYCLSQLETYHWNGGAGDPGPGTIGAQVVSGLGGATGTMLGPWDITASAGTTANDNWTATVPSTPVVIDGTYKCVDSSAGTWSQDDSAQDGFCRVLGYAATATDTTPPNVSIVSPAAHADLSGTVTVSADATDVFGVDRVEFYLDNPTADTDTYIGTASAAPYSVSFDTASVPNCEHDGCTIDAYAYDAAGNSSEASASVGVANPIVVGTVADDGTGTCSLRDAIASANDNRGEGGCLNGLSSITDTIDVPAGTYNLSAGDLAVASDMSIEGSGARSTVITGYADGTRVFEIDSGNVTIGGVTIEGGSEDASSAGGNPGVGGGIWVDSPASLTLENSTVTTNEASTSGAGIDSDGSLSIFSSTIENNTTGSGGFGAGIDDFGTGLLISNSTVMGNFAQGDGGGLYIASGATLLNDTIANNEAASSTSIGSGGGIAVYGATDPHTIYLQNTLLAGNTEQRYGNLVANDCAIGVASYGHNLADDASCALGGTGDQQNVNPKLGSVDTSHATDVLPLLAGSPAIDAGDDMSCPPADEIGTHRPLGAHCDIGAYEYIPTDYYVSTPDELASALSSADSVGSPATIHLAAGHYDIGNTIDNVNVFPHSGGPITLVGAGAASTILDGDGAGVNVVNVNGSAKTTIEGVTVENGKVGVYDTGGSTTVLSDSVVQNNGSVGVQSSAGGMTITGSTIAGNGVANSALDYNGGIYIASTFSAVNATIAGNLGNGMFIDNTVGGVSLQNVTIANNKGAGILDTAATSAVNTIVADNTGGDCIDAQSTLTSGGHNLDSDGSCFSYDNAAGDLHADPQLGPLQDNGGPTPTMALASSSPAVDAGDGPNCPATDQRGVARPQGAACDIGAFELVPLAGSLSGSVSTSGQSDANLTSLGTEDWAVWGYAGSGTSQSLAPDARKANGYGISDLTNVDPTGTPLRGIGYLGFGGVPFSFDWSDGSGPTSETGAVGGLQHDGQQTSTTTSGDGFSFTVPADATERTLTVFASEHWGTGELTASLSDGSAAPYTSAVVGSSYPDAGNAPGVFTIQYKAGSAGQHLTVTWTESGDDCIDFHCDNAAIYAVALSGGSDTKSASAKLSTDPSVEMSGSNDSIDSIPLSAFEVTPQGVTPAPINGLPINGLPINGLPINGLPINGLPINGLPINGLPINGLPINGLPINGLPINGLPINGLPINGLEIPGGWAAVLAGTPLAGLPLQTITLQQVLDPSTYLPNAVPAAVRNLTLGDLELADSALGQITIGALALGGTPINGLGTEAATIEQQLQTWCESAVTSGDPTAECSLADIGNQSLFSLGLEGAPINGLPINGLPINGLPINGLPINGLPINGLDLSASPINGLPINGLPINGLPINGLPVVLSQFVDCTKVDCATATLGEAAAAGAIVPGATYGQLLALLVAPGSAYQDTITLGDVIGLLIKRADVPWETLPPRLLSVFDTKRPTLGVSAGFTIQGAGTPSAEVKLRIPDGFDYDPGSATLAEGDGTPQALADPTVTGQTLDWQISSVDPDNAYTVAFRLRSGTTVGPAQLTETVSSGSQSDTSVATFSVSDSYQTSSDPTTAPTITPNDGVQMSALPSPGAVDYYEIPMPPAGDRLQVHLTNLPADYDLALYSTQTTSVRTGATAAPPLQDGIVSDQQIDLGGGSSGQLAPTPLQDVPDPGIPVVQVSANRGTDDEDVGMVSPGGGGYVTIAVFGYNGAFSAQPYSLRVKDTPPPASESCTRSPFPDAGQGTTPGSLPDLSSLPSNLNTVILVDEKRLGDTYGSTDEATAVAALNHLATGDASLGVSGVVLPVETIPGVPDLYTQWDSNPCNPDAANAVANAIADEVDKIVTARPSVKYVVFGGGDDQIPFFRLPDLSLIANESGFAGQFQPNEYQGSLAAGDLLSDDPYLDTNPVPASGQQLFPPNLSGGRLVETAQDIANAVTAFETAPTPGVLKSSTGFVSGYDFVADGSQRVADNLSRDGVSVQTLDNPLSATSDWGLTALLAAAFPAGGSPADINSWNGHYDNYRAQMANGDVLSTSDPNFPGTLDNGIFFTMGCHAGFQTTDAVVGSTVLDWPQYFSEHDTGFVGNTGFGLGNTDSVAFSEELMADFAGQLGGSVTLGQALEQAKQQYYLSRVAFSNYDEKTLSEAELYGLPMYGVGRAPVSLMAAADPPPDPVPGTSHSTSPSTGSLSRFSTGVQSASFSATPAFTFQQEANGDSYTNAGQVQAPNYRPLQPFVSLPAARGGLVAHGVVIDGLTSEDHTTNPNSPLLPWVPDNVRPTLNSSAAEPPPTFTDEAWPEKIPTLVSLGADQSLNLITGQFFTDTSGNTTTPVERLWTQIAGRVTYSTSQDFTPPTVDSIDAFQSGGIVSFTGRFSDLDQTGAAGTVAFAQVVFDDGSGNWSALPLQYDSTSGTWSGGAPFSGDHVQFFVEACDAAGNCGYSSNKGRYFDAQPLPPASSGDGALELTASGPQSGQWYTGGVSVTATSSAQSVSVSVDGGPFAAGPATLSGDGAHVVEARDSDGHTAEGVYLIDTTGPAISDSVSPAKPDGTNGWYVTKPTVTFSCTDNLSGVASCLADSGGASETLGESASEAATATAKDNAGNASHDSVPFKVDLTAPTAPVFTGIVAQLYAINSLPAQSAIGCTSSDATSRLKGCVVTGYSGAVGSHTLTATATDNAGNTSSATLTYTVGFQAGNVLAPVTAPHADQTSPLASDLQVFKIKSTVPLKFQFYLDSARTTLMTTPPAGSTAVLTVGKHDTSTESIIDSTLVTAPADIGNQFRWTGASDYQYIYNMATSGLTAGTYFCQITLYAADGTTVLGQSLKQYFVLRS